MRKFSNRYLDSKNNPAFMYYHRLIINFKKTAASHPYFLHLLVDIPQLGNDLIIYPKNWTENYIIAYGIIGSASDVDTDKVYDYHTAFEIKLSEMRMNVPLDMKNNAIINSRSIKPRIFAHPGILSYKTYYGSQLQL